MASPLPTHPSILLLLPNTFPPSLSPFRLLPFMSPINAFLIFSLTSYPTKVCFYSGNGWEVERSGARGNEEKELQDYKAKHEVRLRERC